MTDKLPTFEAFWPYYLGEHRMPACRGVHYVGSLAAPLTLVAALTTGNLWLLLLIPICGYGPARVGHFIIEKNRPATFTYPVWSLLGDYKMLGLALRGKMADEVTRLYGSASPHKDAPLPADAG